MTRSHLRAALVFGLAVFAMNAQATERVPDGDPQWPNVPAEKLPVPNPTPSFTDPDQVVARILGRKPGDISADVTGSTARWPELPPDPPPPSPFAFETGARYWFSGGNIKFGFSNGNALFGNPTSTLDWHGLAAHSGEVFARLDHLPSGYFVKGVFGIGATNDGKIDDRDFLAGQLKFSDTTSLVKDGNLDFAMIDFGWAYTPIAGVRLGFFAGYHYWHEKVTAYGLICNQISFVISTCPMSGAIPIGYDTAVLSYEPRWHAIRIGFEGKAQITDRWSFSAEVAGIPYAFQWNNDSHLLRPDLGPVPNVTTWSRYAYGIETEMFINYAITPNIEVGGGVRYWGLTSRYGDVRFGPVFDVKNALNSFDQQRYGLLAQVKGKF